MGVPLNHPFVSIYIYIWIFHEINIYKPSSYGTPMTMETPSHQQEQVDHVSSETPLFSYGPHRWSPVHKLL